MTSKRFRAASIAVITMLSLVIIFHLLILSGIIPYSIAWGGRLKSTDDMITFEAISIILNILMIAIVAQHSGFLHFRINETISRIGVWAMVLLFALNTVGNLLSVNETERIIFTPVTLILSVLCLVLALGKKTEV
ncbi:MAG: hypothetical protein WD824_13125 [Cyclobacteriaceae bacterium]